MESAKRGVFDMAYHRVGHPVATRCAWKKPSIIHRGAWACSRRLRVRRRHMQKTRLTTTLRIIRSVGRSGVLSVSGVELWLIVETKEPHGSEGQLGRGPPH